MNVFLQPNNRINLAPDANYVALDNMQEPPRIDPLAGIRVPVADHLEYQPSQQAHASQEERDPQVVERMKKVCRELISCSRRLQEASVQLQLELNYIHNHPKIKKRILKNVLYGTVIGGTAGACVGTTISLCWALGSLNKAFTIIGGALTGAMAGASLVSSYEIITIARDPEYLEWKKTAIQKGIYPGFVKFINTQLAKAKREPRVDEPAECYISLQLIIDPVKDAGGHVFERAQVYNWIDEERAKDRVPMCPLRCRLLRKEELEDAPEYTLTVANYLRRHQDVFTNGEGRQYIGIMRAYLRAVQEEGSKMNKEECHLISKKNDRGELTNIEASRAWAEAAKRWLPYDALCTGPLFN